MNGLWGYGIGKGVSEMVSDYGVEIRVMEIISYVIGRRKGLYKWSEVMKKWV